MMTSFSFPPIPESKPRSVTDQSVPVLVQARVATSAKVAFSIGQTVVARVLGQLSPQHYSVSIQRMPFVLNVPAGLTFQSEALLLKVQSLVPQLTFSYHSPTTSTALSVPDVTLSAASQYLSQLLQASSTRVVQPLPLMLNLAQPAPQIAVQLQQQVAQSGLFYESHLRQFAQGKISLEAIEKEPQAKQVAFDLRSSTSGNQFSDVVHLLHKQLQALETQQCGFQGEGFPLAGCLIGLIMARHKEIAEQPSSGEQMTEEYTRWSTTLTLQLPQLGSVVFEISLVKKTLVVNARIENPESYSALFSYRGRLEQALGALGLTLSTFTLESVAHESHEKSVR